MKGFEIGNPNQGLQDLFRCWKREQVKFHFAIEGFIVYKNAWATSFLVMLTIESTQEELEG